MYLSAIYFNVWVDTGSINIYNESYTILFYSMSLTNYSIPFVWWHCDNDNHETKMRKQKQWWTKSS